MRVLASFALAATLIYEMVGAGRTFKPAPQEKLKLRINLIWIAAAVLVTQSFRVYMEVWQTVLGILGLLLALGLFEWARRSIQGKFFSFLSSGDRPEFIWKGGPYALVRNPFYTSYLLTYFSAVVMMPDGVSAVVLLVMVWLFCTAALFEEKKFLESPLAEEYAAYMSRTGRFLPKFRAHRP